MADDAVEIQNGIETDPVIPVVETDFAELHDGTLVEMIENPASPSESLLAAFKSGSVRYVERFRDGNRILVPPARTGLLKHVQLPQGVQPYGSGVRWLCACIESLLGECLEIEPCSLVMMGWFVLSTWFPEKLSFAPYLALVGPPGSGKTTALRVLALLCRRSLLTTDISTAAFYDVCHSTSPTLIIDETRTAGDLRKLLHLLKASSARGFVALRKDNARMAYGPKVLSWVELPNDPMLNSRCIIIPMQRTRRVDLRSPDDRQVIEEAAKARRCLLKFRLDRFNSLVQPKIPDGVELSSRPLDLYRALALPIGDDPHMCGMLAYLVADQRNIQSPLLSPVQAACIRVLYESIHQQPKDDEVRLSTLTAAIKSDLGSRGEPTSLTERKVGDLLTALGLTNRARRNSGYVLKLYRDERIRIHALARDYELDCVPTQPTRTCDICHPPGEATSSSEAEQATNQSAAESEKPKGEEGEHREHRARRSTQLRRRTVCSGSGAPERRSLERTVGGDRAND